jgi:membrane protease YdiL (CAAX protease family)
VAGDGAAGDGVAIAGAAAAFALLHVPLYGWRALPLDLAVGVVLGLLRRRAGSATAPAIAHAAADLAGWFLR